MIKHTNQTFIDEVIEYAKNEVHCTTRDGSACQYRNEHNQACLIGHFLTDEQAKWADGQSNSGIDDVHYMLGVLYNDYSLKDVNTDFMVRVQSVHDDIPNNEWQKQLTTLANEFNLTADGAEV